MKKLWNWLKSLFTGERIGVIWRTIFTAAKSSLAQMVCDPENQQKALDLVHDLASSKLTNVLVASASYAPKSIAAPE